MKHSRLEIVVLEKETRFCKIVDVAHTFDTRVIENEREKVDKYQNLKFELKRIWNFSEVTVIPVVISALGAISMDFRKWIILKFALEPHKRPVFLEHEDPEIHSEYLKLWVAT